MRITSSCYALRVRGARDEVRLVQGSIVRVLYFCVPSNNTPSIGSDGFEKVLIGTRGPREAFLDGGERASGEEQRFGVVSASRFSSSTGLVLNMKYVQCAQDKESALMYRCI